MTSGVRVTAFRGEVLAGDAWRGRDFRGLRVAVLAPGSAAAHIVPVVARTARTVKVFQEEPAWVLPALPRSAPHLVHTAAGIAARDRHVRAGLGRLHLRMRVKDPWLRRRLTPDARFGGGRSAASSAYYRALQLPHCTLVTWPVYAVVPTGIRTAEGIEHQVDCIVLGNRREHSA